MCTDSSSAIPSVPGIPPVAGGPAKSSWNVKAAALFAAFIGRVAAGAAISWLAQQHALPASWLAWSGTVPLTTTVLTGAFYEGEEWLWRRYGLDIPELLARFMAQGKNLQTGAAALLLCWAVLLAGCRTVNITLPAFPPAPTNAPPLTVYSPQLRIYVDQSAQPTVSPSILSGLSTNAWSTLGTAAGAAAKAGAL